jgi:3'-phosphoadenosine 5'-phosphosulfate sulfotransferase (PAPS reductase)/FAD synthetase
MIPNLHSYDRILVNSSAGKDSQTALAETVRRADAAGYPRARIVVVHCDLGRVEWEGTRELAELQASHYGLRFEVVKRDRDLLHQLEHERKMWPDMARRWCTSDQKTAQVRKLITTLAGEIRAEHGRQPRILNVLGIRAAESPKRAKMAEFELDSAASSGRRHVDRWLPIFHWTTDQVWNDIRATGIPHHRAYDLGMPRLSCVMCVFASREALLIGVRHNPELAAEYARIEVSIGHRFRQNLSIAELVAEAAELDTDPVAPDWAA